LESLRDGPGDAAPALGFRYELLLARFRQPVVFGAAIVFGVAPEGGDPTFVFHAMQAREEGAGLHVEGATSDLFNSAGDAEAVHFTGDQGFEDEHVEGALQQRGGFVGQAGSPIDCLWEDSGLPIECQ